MPRKPRIEIAGFYHVINRGVEQRTVFLDEDDFHTFEELLCRSSKEFEITVHNFCLMDNHYHLLIEIRKANLAKFMKQLGMSYSIYFNKKYKRSGHLWQGRYKSWYVTDERYLYTLIRYIEQNPLKAGMVKELSEYRFCSFWYFVNEESFLECLKNAWLYENYGKNIDEIRDFVLASVDMDELKEISKASSLVVAPLSENRKTVENLREIVGNFQNKQERNNRIIQAHKEGYSQQMIAKEVGLSQQAVGKIIKTKK